jgi:hypothetical protein
VGRQSVADKRGTTPAIRTIIEDILARKLLLLVNGHIHLHVLTLTIVARKIYLRWASIASIGSRASSGRPSKSRRRLNAPPPELTD